MAGLRLWAWIIAALLLPMAAGEAAAQRAATGELRVNAGVDPDTVTVGERFRSALRIVVPRGYRVEFQEITASDSAEAASPVRVIEQGDTAVAALYELAAWVTGDSLRVSAAVRLIAPDGQATEHRLPLALPVVASVLPSADEPVSPRPLKGLVAPPGPARPFPWWWLLLAAAVLGALIYAWWRFRRRDGSAFEDPRKWAVRELDALLATGDAGEPLELYRKGSRVLREYLARIDSDLGTDLTTGELTVRARAQRVAEPLARQLAYLLEDADRVKFSADHASSLAEARSAVQAAREFVLAHPRPEPAEGRAA